MKTDGTLLDWARAKTRIALIGVMGFIIMVSVWTPFLHERIAER